MKNFRVEKSGCTKFQRKKTKEILNIKPKGFGEILIEEINVLKRNENARKCGRNEKNCTFYAWQKEDGE